MSFFKFLSFIVLSFLIFSRILLFEFLCGEKYLNFGKNLIFLYFIGCGKVNVFFV